MSIRSFTVLAHSLRKRADLDLCLAHIHSTSRSRSFTFHGVTHDSALTLCVGRQRCGKRPGTVHPLPAGQRRVKSATEQQLRRVGCESNASLSRHLPTDVSVERHLSRIRPCLTRPLARCLSRATSPHRTKNVRRGPRFCGSCAALLRLRRPSGFGFQKIFSANLRTERGRKHFPNLPKKTPLGLGSGAHSRRFAQECPE
jgi:hypothetical protein